MVKTYSGEIRAEKFIAAIIQGKLSCGAILSDELIWDSIRDGEHIVFLINKKNTDDENTKGGEKW